MRVRRSCIQIDNVREINIEYQKLRAPLTIDESNFITGFLLHGMTSVVVEIM